MLAPEQAATVLVIMSPGLGILLERPPIITLNSWSERRLQAGFSSPELWKPIFWPRILKFTCCALKACDGRARFSLPPTLMGGVTASAAQVEDQRPDQHNIHTPVTGANWESVSRGILGRLVAILDPSLVLSSP